VTDARSAILSRLRAAESHGLMPPIRDVAVQSAAPRTVDESLARFLDELRALGVTTYVEPTADAVRARVLSIVGSRAALAWDDRCLPYDVGRALTSAARGDSPRAMQAAAAIGVTGCAAAIAETGTLALMTGEGKPRSASLLPPVHLAVVQRADLVWGATEFFERMGHEVASSACCTFVTGPSRTADIELTLTIGVHGPGEVLVVVGP